MTKAEIKRIDDAGLAAWNKHDVEAFVRQFAERFTWSDWTMAEPMRDKAAARRYFSGWMTAFPDMSTKLVNRVIDENTIAAELEFSGTNSGPLMMGGKSMPATKKKVVGRGTYFARIKDGRIVEFRTHPDVAGLMMQLGMMPGM